MFLQWLIDKYIYIFHIFICISLACLLLPLTDTFQLFYDIRPLCRIKHLHPEHSAKNIGQGNNQTEVPYLT